jgi:hypothetical protein
MGGLPGEKNRSLIRGAARNIAASKAGTENGAAAGATAAGDDEVAGAGAEALACGARAGATALAVAVVPVAFGLVTLLDDDMNPRMNRPKFSQSLARNSGYEGHPEIAQFPFFFNDQK